MSKTTATAVDESVETLQRRIRDLAEEKSAVILAHNYQIGPVQDVADYLGDSLGLSRTAATVDAERIVFCGVHFMAETAAILSPEKKVLIPDLEAGCSLAATIDAASRRSPTTAAPPQTRSPWWRAFPRIATSYSSRICSWPPTSPR